MMVIKTNIELDIPVFIPRATQLTCFAGIVQAPFGAAGFAVER